MREFSKNIYERGVVPLAFVTPIDDTANCEYQVTQSSHYIYHPKVDIIVHPAYDDISKWLPVSQISVFPNNQFKEREGIQYNLK